jgi:phage I-like protein
MVAHSPAMKDTHIIHKSGRTMNNELGVSGTAIGQHSVAPEWIELLPAGDFAGRDGRGPFRLSNPSAVIAATDALRMEAGLPIDYDHATDFAAPTGRPAPAAGWIRTIEVRDGALWGQVEWTTHGGAAVVTHEYRYISPVFEYSQDGEVQRLLRAALTNNPNLYLTAISVCDAHGKALFTMEATGQQIGGGAEAPRRASAGAESIEPQLCGLLGLTDIAKPEEIVAGVRRIVSERGETALEERAVREEIGLNTPGNKLTADLARYVPIEQFESTLTELNQLRAAIARERAGFRVDAAMQAGKIVPAQREWAIGYCQANLSGFEKFIARQPTLVTGVTAGFEGEPVNERTSHSSREGEGRGEHRAETSLTRTELSICARLGLRPHDYLKRRIGRGELPTLPQT